MKSDTTGVIKPHKLKSVKSVMWLYSCLLACFLILFVEVVSYFVVVNSFEGRARDKIRTIGNEVAFELQMSKESADNIYRYRGDGVNVYILSFDGNIYMPEQTAEIDKETIRDVLDRMRGVGAGEEVAYRSKESMNFVKRVALDDCDVCVLVTYTMDLVYSAVRISVLYLVIVGLIAMALSFLIAYTLSQKLTRGLQTMGDTAVKLAGGDYSVQFTNVDYKEMAQLSDTLNYVRDEVKKSGDFQHEILANVTHDLKTPLTMIKAYASMIKEISGDNKQKREMHLDVIIEEADRLTGLVDDVLSVSKLQANISEITPKVFNLTELVYGIINKFGYLQESMGYNLMVDIDADTYTRADAEKISQVIYNLLGNAANYTGEDKTVYISLKRSLDGERIKFSVRDTGKGIPADKIPEIWNRYYREKENHVRPVKGTGLGLNIVKVILENHSFDFGVESEVGKGSTFWVDFPAVPEEIKI